LAVWTAAAWHRRLLNSIGDDEAVLFGDAVHPTHAVPRFGQLG
jgi:hypothetical protein